MASAGPPVQPGDQFRVPPGQLGPQVLGEQVVVAVGRPLIVERDDEQVAAFQFPQHGLGVGAAGHRRAQRDGEFLQQASAQQEGDDIFGLTGEHVLGQEVGDVPAGPGEPVHEFSCVRTAAQRQRGQVHDRWPALRAFDQPGHHLFRLRYISGGEQPDRLSISQGQVRHSQLHELAVGSQASQREKGIGSGGQGQLASGRQPLAQVADGRVTPAIGHRVQVVEDQDEGAPGISAGGDESWQHHIFQRRIRRAQKPGQRTVELEDRPEGGDHAGQEDGRVVVGRVEGNPRERPLIVVTPRGQQRRFPVSGRRGDEHHRSMGR